jgi:tRNA (cytidine56-2'-O)-methyltransferase
MSIIILRIGHRPERDARITTHVGLTARVLGADGMLLAASDRSVVESIEKVSENWGGNFHITHEVNWKRAIAEWKQRGGKVVHLTMYGVNLPEALSQINPQDPLMIAVGAEKVPSELYQLADYNIAVGNQPHSEIAALALFLDRLNAKRGVDPLTRKYPESKLTIIPQERGKKVIERKPEHEKSNVRRT